MVAEAIVKDSDGDLDILELGTGKGGTALSLLDNFPNASYEGMDYNDEALKVAKEQLAVFEKAKLTLSSFMDFKPNKVGYDAVVAVLALHHLTSEEKPLMLRRIKGWLKPGGVLVIGDLIKLDDSELDKRAVEIFNNYRQSSLSGEELQEIREHVNNDPHIIETLDDTRQMVLDAGFKSIDVWWWYYRMAVLVIK